MTNWWREYQHPARHPSTASKYSSNHAQSQPPSVSPHSLDYSLQVHICILARSRTPSASPTSLDLGLQVCLQPCLITANKCISPNSLDHGHQVNISKLTRSRSPSASLSSLSRHVQARLKLLSSTTCRQSRYTMCRWVAIISNDPTFCQKHPHVPDCSDSSEGTSYPLMQNHTLPIAQATGRVAYLPPLLCCEVYAPSEWHVCYTLSRGCSYAVAIYTMPGDGYALLRPIATCHTLIYV